MYRYFIISSVVLLMACAEGRLAKIPKPSWRPFSRTQIWTGLRQHSFCITPERALYPHASLDGRYIVYSSNHLHPHRYQIFLRDALGGAPLQLTQGFANSLYPKISPDGKYIAYASDKDGRWNIYVLERKNPAGVMQISLDGEENIAPSWSSDGKRLAYCRWSRHSGWEIVVVDLQKSTRTILGPGLYPEWNPKDQQPARLVFEGVKHSHFRNSRIMTIREDGSELKEITIDSGLILTNPMPKWSPDGRWIVFSGKKKEEETENIYLIKPDGSLLTKLTKETTKRLFPTWGGERIFFVWQRMGTGNIYSVKPFSLEFLEE
jgi:TolB protein